MKHAWHRIRFWLCWPGLFLYFYNSHRSRVVIRHADQLLLVQDRSKVWFDDDRWTVPGGGIDKRETPAEGAVRELQEELGIVTAASDLRPLWQGIVQEYGLRYTAHFFALDLDSPVVPSLQRSEVAAAEWLRRDALSDAILKTEGRLALQLLADH